MTVCVLLLFMPAAWADTLQRIQQGETVTIGVANEIPYGYLDEKGTVTGEAPEIAKVILQQLGTESVEVVITEFGALIPGLKAGRFDLIAAGMYITPKRCRQIQFSNPTYAIGEGFLVPTGNPKKLHGYDDIKANSVKLGVMAGAVEYGYARDFGIGLQKLVTLPDYPSGVAALKAGRVDALAGTSLTMAQLAQKDTRVELAQPFTPLVIDGQSVKGFGGFGFRKKDHTLSQAFNQQLTTYIGTEAHLALIEPFGFGRHTLPGTATAEALCKAD
ncbi:ectoine/hydroxyectoine ABC transporter substrate-binding protein EhuB [Pontibacter sp. JAM-7]|uniref:ectoine/hydroxyectoine ABC transporter substrate-binding protein EhuB n=1 Tax=Pontibacter sp. JAM-7 TaxID=3366581 RepID=UPI003AF57199